MHRRLLKYRDREITISEDKLWTMINFAMEMSSFFAKFDLIIGDTVVLYGELLLNNKINIKRKVKASVEIHIFSDLSKIPEVFCINPWIKRDIDWHVNQEGKLCWELYINWQEKILLAQQNDALTINNICQYASNWCMNSVITLLNYHWIGHLEEITTWNPRWVFWKHGNEGIRQYEKEKKQSSCE